MARLMVVVGATVMLLGLALMGYQRLGWPRSDLFAAGSFVFTVLCFIAAALAIPGMPRFFNLETHSKTLESGPDKNVEIDGPRKVVPGKRIEEEPRSQTAHRPSPDHTTLAKRQKQSALDANPRTSAQPPSRPTDQSLATRTVPSSAGNPNAEISVPQAILPMAVPQVVSANPYGEVGRLHDRVMSLSYEWSGALLRINQDFARPYKMGKPFPMPSKLPDDLAQRLADSDEEISGKYAALNVEIRKTREVALKYMQLTPNQTEEDASRFQSATSAAMRRTSVANLLSNTPDSNRFGPIAQYLAQLQHQLGELH